MCYSLLIHLKDHQMNNKSNRKEKHWNYVKQVYAICLVVAVVAAADVAGIRSCFLCNTNFMLLHCNIVHYFVFILSYQFSMLPGIVHFVCLCKSVIKRLLLLCWLFVYLDHTQTAIAYPRQGILGVFERTFYILVVWDKWQCRRAFDNRHPERHTISANDAAHCRNNSYQLLGRYPRNGRCVTLALHCIFLNWTFRLQVAVSFSLSCGCVAREGVGGGGEFA